jgi:hypothetical protein
MNHLEIFLYIFLGLSTLLGAVIEREKRLWKKWNRRDRAKLDTTQITETMKL